MADYLAKFKAARRVSTPIVTLNTPDPGAAIARIAASFNGSAPPILRWDCVSGLKPLNEKGVSALSLVRETVGQNPESEDGALIRECLEQSASPMALLTIAAVLPQYACVFAINLNLFWDEPTVVQAVWNLRDTYKTNGRTFVIVANGIRVPPVLKDDILSLDEPLPDRSWIEHTVKRLYVSADVAEPDSDTLSRAADATIGLSAFKGEQSLAMAMTATGIDIDLAWDEKEAAINAIPGLTIHKPKDTETYAEIGGCNQAKDFLSMSVVDADDAPSVVVWFDELEKQNAGEKGDLTGISQDFAGVFLNWTQEISANGVIFVGPPGAAKSAMAKATANTARKKLIKVDLGAMRGGIVGESEGNIRRALEVIRSVSEGRIYMIATCNGLDALTPELKRRFKDGIFFFDLPSAEERAVIWDIYLKRFGLEDMKDEVATINDNGWTGAEIEICVSRAKRFKCSLTKSSKFVVPVSVSSADAIKRLRTQASGRFLAASGEGWYTLPERDTVTYEAPVTGERKLTFADDK